MHFDSSNRTYSGLKCILVWTVRSFTFAITLEIPVYFISTAFMSVDGKIGLLSIHIWSTKSLSIASSLIFDADKIMSKFFHQTIMIRQLCCSLESYFIINMYIGLVYGS